MSIVAAACGRLVAAYSRLAITPVAVEILLESPLPPEPCVWIGWHEGNLITLALHRHVTKREAMAFVPPGLRGTAMRGWLEGLGVMPVALAADARRGLGLRQMEAALAGGRDVLIALDGPGGPRHHVAPGAVWLARVMGAEVRPVGVFAVPSLELPRWDRLIVPLPGARIAVVIGGALPLGRRQEPAGIATAIAASLNALTARAREAVSVGQALRVREIRPWR